MLSTSVFAPATTYDRIVFRRGSVQIRDGIRSAMGLRKRPEVEGSQQGAPVAAVG